MTKAEADAARDQARAKVDDENDVAVDPDAEVEETEEGYWVQARIFVPKG